MITSTRAQHISTSWLSPAYSVSVAVYNLICGCYVLGTDANILTLYKFVVESDCLPEDVNFLVDGR